ncbi:MAG: hypothetical protein QXJ99_03785, partial [Thermofilum sp.]
LLTCRLPRWYHYSSSPLGISRWITRLPMTARRVSRSLSREYSLLTRGVMLGSVSSALEAALLRELD